VEKTDAQLLVRKLDRVMLRFARPLRAHPGRWVRKSFRGGFAWTEALGG